GPVGPVLSAMYLGLQPLVGPVGPVLSAATVFFWSAGMCLGTVVGAFAFTEIQAGTGLLKDRDYFLTSAKAHEHARGMQLKATTAVKGIWAFSPYHADLKQYFTSMLACMSKKNIHTIRIIDLANLPIEDISTHIGDALTYLRDVPPTDLRPLYEIRFCANIDYEMLIIDNSEQYLCQLRKVEGGLRGMNTTQARDLVENLA